MEKYRIRIACFLILSFSIVWLSGTSNSFLNKSWAGESQNNSDSDDNQAVSTMPSQDSEGANQKENKLTREVSSGDEVSEDNNQTTTEVTGENESNQTAETQNQTQNNQTVNI